MPEIISERPQMVHLRMDAKLWQFFRGANISFGQRSMQQIPTIWIMRDAKIEEYASFDGPPRFLTSMGSGSYANSGFLVGPMGRYCSIADRVQTMGERHPIEHVTTSSFPYRVGVRTIFDKMRRDFGIDATTVQPKAALPLPSLGHDVWIGTGAVLARGISLGTGCIVATGAIVTKDVPPYAIVGGNPAHLIRMRFDADIVRGLLDLEWWNFSPRALFDHDIRDPRAFIDTMQHAKSQMEPFMPRVLTCEEILAG
jgi:acetyltransferase-like isoleucine patch superfamily enzyme